ncbi:hypothetical protein [Helicobacter sp.]|nr:hypothetical protein [Helicobacter sp.]
MKHKGDNDYTAKFQNLQEVLEILGFIPKRHIYTKPTKTIQK